MISKREREILELAKAVFSDHHGKLALIEVALQTGMDLNQFKEMATAFKMTETDSKGASNAMLKALEGLQKGISK
ncbi:MAG: hypothetical protein HQK78_14455 [Desulfobacterales bacterium]|nr:hypothetical protein [Desulfobacterales bacterium]